MTEQEKRRKALNDLVQGKYSLHIPPEKDDVDIVLSDALDKLVRYERALKDISEHGGIDMLGKSCAKVAKEALS